MLGRERREKEECEGEEVYEKECSVADKRLEVYIKNITQILDRNIIKPKGK